MYRNMTYIGTYTRVYTYIPRGSERCTTRIYIIIEYHDSGLQRQV